MENTPAAPDPASKSDPLLDELLTLNRQGEANPAKLAALEARLEARFRKEQEETDRLLAEMKAWQAGQAQRLTPTKAPLVLGWWLAPFALVICVFAGFGCAMTLGSGFVFSFASQYWLAAPWIFFVAMVPWVALFLRSEVRERLREQHPSWAVRWLLVVPLLAVGMAGLTVIAAPGWAALLGRVASGPAVEQQARVVSVGKFSKSARGCDQSAEFLTDHDVVSLCLEGRMAGDAPAVGDQVLLVGHASWFGLTVEEIRSR